VKDSNLRPIG